MSGSYQGWQRQDYGGPKFLRLRGTPVSQVWTTTVMGDKLRLWYSAEAAGAEFTPTVDGVSHVINCAGVLRYQNIFDLNLSPGGHIVTFNPPATGNAYIEWLEAYDSSRPGVLSRNATLGGSSLRNCRNRTNSSTTGNPAVAAIVGTNGLAAYAQTDVDLILITWHVNLTAEA